MERYVAKDGFVKRDIAGETLLVAVGERTQEFNGMVMLNETGAFLWDLLSEPKSGAEMVAALLEEFETDDATAERDIRAFLDKGLENGVIGKQAEA